MCALCPKTVLRGSHAVSLRLSSVSFPPSCSGRPNPWPFLECTVHPRAFTLFAPAPGTLLFQLCLCSAPASSWQRDFPDWQVFSLHPLTSPSRRCPDVDVSWWCFYRFISASCTQTSAPGRQGTCRLAHRHIPAPARTGARLESVEWTTWRAGLVRVVGFGVARV